MMIYNVWAYDNYYPCGPDDLKGTFLNLEDAQNLVQLIHERGWHYDDEDWEPRSYVSQYDNVRIIETEVK